jgi:hypothetical protein
VSCDATQVLIPLQSSIQNKISQSRSRTKKDEKALLLQAIWCWLNLAISVLVVQNGKIITSID